jgi:hypothetical protein
MNKKNIQSESLHLFQFLLNMSSVFMCNTDLSRWCREFLSNCVHPDSWNHYIVGRCNENGICHEILRVHIAIRFIYLFIYFILAVMKM